VLFWVGVDFLYDDLTNAGYPDDREFSATDALAPSIGFTFSKDNLSVGTSLGINLSATTDKGDDTIGFIGGVDFSIKF